MDDSVSKPKILYVMRDDGGCGYYRCRMPSEYIRRAGLAEVRTRMNIAQPEDLKWADLVVFQEMGSVVAMKMINFCRENGVPFITEIDDFIHHVSPNNAGGYGAWNPGTLYIARACEQMRKSLGLTVSTEWLAREYFPYNKNIFVVPNYLDKEKWDSPIQVREDGKIRVGWAGGNAHGDDLRMISKVIDKITKEFKGKVIFETFGMHKVELLKIFEAQDFSETCPQCGYEGEMHNYPGEALDNYPMILASKGWDIGLAPVINNSFGNAKSDLKIKEYSAIGVPVVASSVTPYKDAAKGGASILFADTYDEWYTNIKKLIKDKSLREKIRHKNKKWVDEYWIQNNVERIMGVYVSFLNQVQNINREKK